ncbi:uncharacterized protein LOC134209715 [Armigeres subalbatus]|uniref:uncharacterized protein LOC134209715 n=1 Tax=Armigeres subalbatus TaxID=124917 RepID=UPI002ED5E895
MSLERRIKGLKTKQKSILSSFGLIKTYVEKFDEGKDAIEIPARLENLNALWKDYKGVQEELESIDETIEEQFKERAEFETAYYRVKGFLLSRESATELHSLVEKFEANVKVLAQLGERTEFWDLILIRMLSSRLDPTTRRDWEEYSSTKNGITFKELTSFIQRRVTVLQTIQGRAVDTPASSYQSKKPVSRPVSSHGASQMIISRKCSLCSSHHPLYMCPVFSKLEVGEKEKEIRRLQLCRNCLRSGHHARDCTSSTSCRKCRGRHHTQLCAGEKAVAVNSRTVEPSSSTTLKTEMLHEQPTTSASATINDPISYASSEQARRCVLLATAVVKLVDDNGTVHIARALLDSGSECCFMTESFSQLVRAHRRKISVPISGIGQSSTQARYKISASVRSRVSDFSTFAEFLVLPKVTIDLPSATIETSTWEIPSGILLADPQFHEANPIDIIIGAEVFFDLFRVPGRIQLGESLPTLVNSVLGWIVSGKTSSSTPKTPVISNLATITDVHQMLEKFWTLEEDHAAPNHSVDEAHCEEYFRSTVKRNSEGRYIVRLPLKEKVINQLGDNRNTAIRRFRMLETRLRRNCTMANQYCTFMDEYLNLGHMRFVQDYQSPPPLCYHMPHHAVIREDSATTKLRVVFDASCKSINGLSLNDASMVGPTVQQEIRSIIMRSRIHKVMIIADIKQMYRQVLVDERDTPLQRIVWRSSPEHPLGTYELLTVTYGTASAPFLATRVLQQLADDEQQQHPTAAATLRKDFYVDDLYSGANSIDEAIELRQQLEALLLKGGFQLRKWASNEEAVLDGVPLENRALQTSFDLDRDQSIKSLGLLWEPALDQLKYKIKLPQESPDAPLTKRSALSQIARLFDPLGLLGPVVVTAKLFMQALWMLKNDNGKVFDWDQELPSSMRDTWLSYCTQLPLLNNLRIDRFALATSAASVQYHFFSDASKHAYGACCYLRSTDTSGAIKVTLLTAKSRVAPLKQQSIPRLELCGALLASELYQKVTAALEITGETFFWVDSTTVISWLQATPSSWATFVANRVSKIQLTTQNCSWQHVAGQENPADCLSRGIPAENILNNKLWWQGPNWLQLDQQSWPSESPNQTSDGEILMEARKQSSTACPASTEPSFVDILVGNFSNLNRLLNVVAYCQRFIRHCRRQPSINADPTYITTEERHTAEITIIRLIQQQSYPEEWKQLNLKRSVSPRSRLRWFNPFISPEQVIRIGGRLNQAPQPFDSKHQLLLPATHPFSKLLVRSCHEKNLHAAPQLLITIIRLRYWITGARSLARSITRNCVTCVRARPKLLEQFMVDLPASRVTATRPFTVTGIDYWGPITLQPIHRRAAPRKAYVAVFVCFSTRAVHLELVIDLSTAKFIQALRRFVSRRGLCSDIHSDNGRNFIGAANEFRQLIRSKEYKQSMATECSENGIRWHFNPPKASNFGGLWEAAIRSAQKHFNRVLKNHTLPHDEMETLLTQIESCLNSRPITPLSDDSTDFEVLTPGHFLIGSPLKAVPQIDSTEIPFNRLRLWQQTQKMFQLIWKRWHAEYLSTLQPRTKWFKPPIEIKINQLVLLRDDNSPPMNWPTARIIDLHPGADGIIRVVTVQSPTGRFIRPVNKICLLPIPPTQTTNTENESE